MVEEVRDMILHGINNPKHTPTGSAMVLLELLKREPYLLDYRIGKGTHDYNIYHQIFNTLYYDDHSHHGHKYKPR